MEERSGQMMGSELKLLYTGKIRRGGGGSSPQFFFVNFPPALYCHERLKQARTSRLVSLAFSRQTGFPSASIRDGRKVRTAKHLCVTNATGYYYVFCRDLHLTMMFFVLLLKDLFKGKWSLAKRYFKQNYCHACDARFAVFFLLPSCTVSSLLLHSWS